MNAKSYTSMNKQFYPTPENIGRQLLRHVDWKKVTAILEPSAGKGDLLRLVKGQAKIVECIELDPNLQAILRDKGYNVIGDDFLTHDTYTSYDLVIMNPPFADGAKHLLKALDLCKHGGQVCCILNAETLRNPCDRYREKLVDLLEEHAAIIEYVKDGFAHAERKTGVEVALVYVNILKKEVDFDMFSGMEIAKDYAETYKSINDNQLATNDAIANAVRRFNQDSEVGLSLINAYENALSVIPHSEIATHVGAPLISLDIESSEDGKDRLSRKNRFIRELRVKYWTLLAQLDAVSDNMTYEMRQDYMSNIQKMRSYDFTTSNIMQFMINITKGHAESTETAIMKVFDRLTYEHSMDNCKNVHYFSGWKTNSAFMIRKKVIIKCYGMYTSYHSASWWHFRDASDILDELEKILTYLDGNRTQWDGEKARHILNRLDTNNYHGEKVEFKYFNAEFKMKGTIHLWFKDLELLKKLNIFGASKKGWLPNGYGKKGYEDMTPEEQNVIDSFHCHDSKANASCRKAKAKKEYSRVMANAAYYTQLETANILMIGMGG